MVDVLTCFPLLICGVLLIYIYKLLGGKRDE